MSRTGTPSLRSSSEVPPVEMISTPCFSRARANSATPVLSETEMSARLIFMERKLLAARGPDGTKDLRGDPAHAQLPSHRSRSALEHDVLRHRVERRAA